MTAAKIRIGAASDDVTILSVGTFLEALIDDSEITRGSASQFTALIPGTQFRVTLEGSGFAYARVGGEDVLAGGVVTAITARLGGDVALTVETSLSAASLAASSVAVRDSVRCPNGRPWISLIPP